MKKVISIFICLLLVVTSVLATTNKTEIGSYQYAKETTSANSAEQESGLVFIAAFVLGFYNGYMDTKREYQGSEVLALVSIDSFDAKDFSTFDN